MKFLRGDRAGGVDEDGGRVVDFYVLRLRRPRPLLSGKLSRRLLGHPDPIQGGMRLECQLVSHGLYCGDSTGTTILQAADLEAARWIGGFSCRSTPRITSE
jgi:hypothetical protein